MPTRDELLILYALAVATRQNTDYVDTVDTAEEIVDYLIEKLEVKPDGSRK